MGALDGRNFLARRRASARSGTQIEEGVHIPGEQGAPVPARAGRARPSGAKRGRSPGAEHEFPRASCQAALMISFPRPRDHNDDRLARRRDGRASRLHPLWSRREPAPKRSTVTMLTGSCRSSGSFVRPPGLTLSPPSFSFPNAIYALGCGDRRGGRRWHPDGRIRLATGCRSAGNAKVAGRAATSPSEAETRPRWTRPAY